MKNIYLNFLFFLLSISLLAQENLITNISGRNTVSLNGTGHYIVDPYETGFFNYRYNERNENDGEAYWNKPVIKNKTDRIEHGYKDPYAIQGTWRLEFPGWYF